MRTKVEQESTEIPIFNPASRQAEEEVGWARRQARRASFRVLLPFLIAIALGIVHRIDGVFWATRDLRGTGATGTCCRSRITGSSGAGSGSRC